MTKEIIAEPDKVSSRVNREAKNVAEKQGGEKVGNQTQIKPKEKKRSFKVDRG